MQHGTDRKQGWFIGSSVVEAGGKTVIGARCKQAGRFWAKPGAEKVLALRGLHANRRLGEFRKYRLNQHAKRNDPRSLCAWEEICLTSGCKVVWERALAGFAPCTTIHTFNDSLRRSGGVFQRTS